MTTALFGRDAQVQTSRHAPPLAEASDLSVEAFVRIRDLFFERQGAPRPFQLRDKQVTQDDPLDEMIAAHLAGTLDPSSGMAASKATGPLITPDIALYRPGLCDKASATEIRTDLRRAVGIEVKKLKPAMGGFMARTSGMDYNSTPPCGTARVYTMYDQPVDIRSFYLFVFEEPADDGSRITMMALCDGNLLNADFDLYLATTGTRSKQINLGTYGDGANRIRPMMIFANPFTADVLAGNISLVHPDADLEGQYPSLKRAGAISRTKADGTGVNTFHVYRHVEDGDGGRPFDLLDPFRMPQRKAETAQRGRFKIDVRLG